MTQSQPAVVRRPSNDQDAWMPLWIGAYLADTGRFTTEQHGAYLLLIMDYWRNGPPPDDEGVLATITRLGIERGRQVGAPIRDRFIPDGGVLRHKRIEEELVKAKERASAASTKAQKAAQARWARQAKQSSKESAGQCSEHAPSIPQALHEQCPTPPPTPIDTHLPLPRGRTGGSIEVFPMSVDWRPSDQFKALAKLAGLPVNQPGFPGPALGEFVSFWFARPDELRTQAEWDHALIKSLQADKGRQSARQTPQRRASSHAGFNDKDYATGVNSDGSLA